MNVIGYLRAAKNAPGIKRQKASITNYYESRLEGSEWLGYYQDRLPNGRRPDNVIPERPRLQRAAELLTGGGILLVPTIGVLFVDMRDALENMPNLLGRKVRVIFTIDAFEMTFDHLKLFRLLRDEWWFVPTKKPEPPKIPQPSKAEMRFQQYCYRKRIIEDKPLVKIVDLCHANGWEKHPRTRNNVTWQLVNRAINNYYQVLGELQTNPNPAAWIKNAQKIGYYNETADDIIKSRIAELSRLSKAVKK